MVPQTLEVPNLLEVAIPANSLLCKATVSHHKPKACDVRKIAGCAVEFGQLLDNMATQVGSIN